MGEVTLLCEGVRGGGHEAFDRVSELLDPELRRIAHRRPSRGARDRRMETTALVNECHLKFIQRRRGMDDAEIAEALDLSRRTVARDGDKARLLPAQALRR